MIVLQKYQKPTLPSTLLKIIIDILLHEKK